MARIWFYNIPYHGHINPTLPLMRELVARGDEVIYFAGPAFAESIAATGAVPHAYSKQAAFGTSRDSSHIVHQGALIAEAAGQVLGEVFAAIERERPDLLMFDMSAPWGNMASRRFGIPAIACFPHLPFYWRTITSDPRVRRKALASLRPGYGHYRALQRQTWQIAQDHKLRKPADINVLSSSAELNIAFLTRYFQPYAEHFDSSYVYVGPTIDTTRQEVPMAIEKAADQRLIYIAVGTLYRANIEFFQACMAAFDDPGFTVIMSVGKAVDPAALGAIPENFTVAQYVPQLQVLEAADVFITHGGMSSINEAVTFDVPMVVVPNTVEQSINASRIEQLHCGIYLAQALLTPATLRASVARLLHDPTIRPGLAKLRQSFEEAGGTRLAADVVDRFKQRHGLDGGG